MWQICKKFSSLLSGASVALHVYSSFLILFHSDYCIIQMIRGVKVRQTGGKLEGKKPARRNMRNLSLAGSSSSLTPIKQAVRWNETRKWNPWSTSWDDFVLNFWWFDRPVIDDDDRNVAEFCLRYILLLYILFRFLCLFLREAVVCRGVLFGWCANDVDYVCICIITITWQTVIYVMFDDNNLVLYNVDAVWDLNHIHLYICWICVFFFSFDFNLLRMKILKLEILNVLI